jgi:tryptophan-rich sensory protein
MGISLFWIWTQPPSKERNIALFAFGVQMLLNLGWSFIFFYFRELGYALIEIITLWLSIVTMLMLFYRIKPKAAYINVPYILWVSFATLLNAAFYTGN